MQTITVSDTVYDSLRELARERHVSLEQLLAELVVQERWEDHAAQAYDAYHARQDEPHEVLSEDEFLQSLREAPKPGDVDADL